MIVEFPFFDNNGAAVSNATVYVNVRRLADGYYYDFDDATFKAGASVVTIDGQLTEDDQTRRPGIYVLDITTSAWNTGKYSFSGRTADAAPIMRAHETRWIVGGEEVDQHYGVPGVGARAINVTVQTAALVPISEAQIWATTDAAGTNVVGSDTATTLGVANLQLDAGTYYLWAAKAGYEFTNPETMTIVAGSGAQSVTKQGTAVTGISAETNYGTTSVRLMLGALGVNLHDLEDRAVPILLKLQLLNAAQDRLLDLLPRERVKWLEQIAEEQALDADGHFNLASLSPVIWQEHKGLEPDRGVRITDGQYCRRISDAEGDEAQRYSYTFTTDCPKYRVQGAEIVVLPGDDDTTIDLQYLRRPNQMVLATTEGSDVNCEFTGALVKVIVGLAGEDFQDESPRAARAVQQAYQIIEEQRLNSQQTASIDDRVDFLRAARSSVDDFGITVTVNA